MSAGDGADEADRIRAIVREVLEEEIGSLERAADSSETEITRRQVLGALVAGGSAGFIGGAGAASIETVLDPDRSGVSRVAPNVYRWADGGYAGPNAARSRVTPETGEIFVGWDPGSEAIYRGESGSWVRIADLGAIGSGRGAATSMADITVPDDYASMEDAIASLNSGESAVIDWRADGYDPTVESRPIPLDTSVLISGHWHGDNTKITFPEDSTPIFDVDLGSLNNRYKIGFENLWIEGGRTLWDVTSAQGWAINHVRYMNSKDGAFDFTDAEFSGWGRFFDLQVSNFVNTGIDMSGAKIPPNDCSFWACQVRRGGDGSQIPQDDATPGTGIGVKLAGFGVEWWGGNVEKLAGPGFVFDQDQASAAVSTIIGVYHESVAKAESGTSQTVYEVTHTGQRNIVIKNPVCAPGGTKPTYLAVIDAPNVRLERPLREDAQVWSTSGEYEVLVEAGGDDANLVYHSDMVPTTINSGAQRVTWGENFGTNEGDPSSTGEWNGGGFEGAIVRDTTNDATYAYVDGSWVDL